MSRGASRGVAGLARRLLAPAWALERSKITVAALLVVAGALAAPALAFALAWMTGRFLADDHVGTALAGALVAVLAVIALSAGHFAHLYYFEVSEAAELQFDQDLARASNDTVGVTHQEQFQHADALTVLHREGRQFHTGLEALLGLFGLVPAMVLTAVLLARVHPALLMLPLAVLPPLLTARWAETVVQRGRQDSSEATRLALNLFHLATDPRHAGELRVFGLGPELACRHERVWGQAHDRLWRAQALAALLRATGQLVFATAYGTAVFMAVRASVEGDRAVSDVVLVVALAVQVNVQVTTVVTLAGNLSRVVAAHNRLLNLTEAADQDCGSGHRSPPDRLHHGIDLEAVGFAYPGQDRPALRDVNLHLPAGSTVAVIGENGAGKSTLVKLLMGLYRPSSGRITVDLTDQQQLRATAWRGRMSAGFQDFARYEFSLGETVGVGDLPRCQNHEAVRDALGRAGALDVCEAAPQGLRTRLGASQDGPDLSGGQWQKLAIGRAFMRDEPLLLVLDEPSSALDAAAEDELFQRYAERAARIGASTGAITVLVSHRFSTVRMADVIVVLSESTVVEVGSHEDLMLARGLYADLYGIQSRAYS
jgi:ATP-binding cassette, subfamily B, bacterial